MKRVITYYCDTPPKREEIEEALDLVKVDTSILIELKWRICGYNYNVVVSNGDTIESVKDRLPKRYGV